MQHNHTIDGYAFCLRPAVIDDAQFIFALREDQQYFNEGAKTAEEQQAWMQGHQAQPDDYYFIVEAKKNRRPVGAFRIIAHSQAPRARLESWAVLPDSLASVESFLLMGNFTFTTLGMQSLEALAICENSSAISTYKAVGAKIIKKSSVNVKGRTYSCEILAISAQDWEKHAGMLKGLSMQIAQKISPEK